MWRKVLAPVWPWGLCSEKKGPVFGLSAARFFPAWSGLVPCCGPWTDRLPDGDGPAEARTLSVSRSGYAVAVVTLSDKGYAGQREDRSGPALQEALRAALPLCHEQRFLLPDEPAALRALVLELAVGQGYDLIVSTGGTGLAPRDLTPEALLPVLDRRVPGFEQAMMQASLAKTPARCPVPRPGRDRGGLSGARPGPAACGRRRKSGRRSSRPAACAGKIGRRYC